MKKILFLAIIALSFAGCQRSCNSFTREFQTSTKNYDIKVYSGGKLVEQYKFKGILDNQKNSDGYFFYKNDTLIEISGDIIIKSY